MYQSAEVLEFRKQDTFTIKPVCKNCGCFIAKDKKGIWKHQSYSDKKILTDFCYICGCLKAEPLREVGK